MCKTTFFRLVTDCEQPLKFMLVLKTRQNSKLVQSGLVLNHNLLLTFLSGKRIGSFWTSDVLQTKDQRFYDFITLTLVCPKMDD